MIKNTRITVFILCLLVLNSCSYPDYCFVRNYSSHALAILFIYPRYDYHEAYYEIPYKSEILPIDNKTIDKLNENLVLQTLDSSNLILIIPPHSTVAISPYACYMNHDILSIKKQLVKSIQIDTLKLYLHTNGNSDTLAQFDSVKPSKRNYIFKYDYKDK